MTLLIGGGILYALVRDTIESNIESELKHSSQAIVDLVKISATVSSKNYLRAIVERNKELTNYYYIKFQQGFMSEADAKKAIVELMQSQQIGQTGYMYAIDSQGICVFHPKENINGKDLSSYAFIQQQLAAKEGYLEFYWREPGEPKARQKAIFMTYFEPWDWVLTASSYREEFQALIAIDDVRDSVTSIQFGETGYPYILTSKGDIVVHPKLTENVYNVTDAKGWHFIRDMCAKKKGKIIYSWKNPDEKYFREKLVYFDYIPEYDWLIAASSYTEEFYRPLGKIRSILIGAFFMLLLIIIPSSLALVFFLNKAYKR